MSTVKENSGNYDENQSSLLTNVSVSLNKAKHNFDDYVRGMNDVFSILDQEIKKLQNLTFDKSNPILNDISDMRSSIKPSMINSDDDTWNEDDVEGEDEGDGGITHRSVIETINTHNSVMKYNREDIKELRVEIVHMYDDIKNTNIEIKDCNSKFNKLDHVLKHDMINHLQLDKALKRWETITVDSIKNFCYKEIDNEINKHSGKNNKFQNKIYNVLDAINTKCIMLEGRLSALVYAEDKKDGST